MQDEPLFRDALFRQKRKHGVWRELEAPLLPAPVADTHAHVQMLADPALELARCAAHGVGFVCCITDPCEDEIDAYASSGLAAWLAEAPQVAAEIAGEQASSAVPCVRLAAGVHPHNAKLYDQAAEARLVERLRDERTCVLGEIGLDYHYDLSPRDVQKEVFRRQIRLAKQAGLPIALHMREAHDDGFRILEEEGFPEAGTLLHCFNLDVSELRRWADAGCYIAFGGPLTFKRADEVREAAAFVPVDRLLTETDAPYMTPEPMRGATCGPAHVIWTANMLCDVRGAHDQSARCALLEQLYENAQGLLDRAPTAWQKGA